MLVLGFRTLIYHAFLGVYGSGAAVQTTEPTFQYLLPQPSHVKTQTLRDLMLGDTRLAVSLDLFRCQV